MYNKLIKNDLSVTSVLYVFFSFAILLKANAVVSEMSSISESLKIIATSDNKGGDGQELKELQQHLDLRKHNESLER